MQERPTNFWSPSDQAEIIKVLTIIINGQKTYGKDVSIKDTYEYYKLKLDGKYPSDRVINAIQSYTDTKSDLPAPSDLITILEPKAEPRISTAEFIHAKECWKNENFPTHSYWAGVVKQYERENAEDRAPKIMTEDPKLLEIARNSMKRIS